MQPLFREDLGGCPKKTSQCKASLVQAGGLASMTYLVATSVFQFLFHSFCVFFLLSPCMLFSVALTLLYSFLFSFCMPCSIFFVDFRRTKNIEEKKEGGLEGDEQDEIFPEEEEKEEEEEKAKEQETDEKGEGQEVAENGDKEETKGSGQDEKAQEDQAEEGKEDDR